MSDKDEEPAGYASPPCFAHELDQDHVGSADPQTVRDVARFRKAERARLIEARLAVPAEARAEVAGEIADALDRLIAPGDGTTISLYWPFRGELDLRGWMERAHRRGARIALPCVVVKAQPLVFREWEPGCRLERGIWNIPVPADGAEITPTVVISPLVGFDERCFRLGYGGGYYDRTLAALSPRPRVIGVGLPLAAIPTIFPQSYDIPMDTIVTGRDRVLLREGAAASGEAK